MKQPESPNATEESVAHKEQGDANLMNGDFDAAMACYKLAIALNPVYAKAHSNLGYIFSELGDFAKAESCLKTAISIDPGNADTHYMLGTIFQSQGQTKDAIHHFRRALELDPNHEFAYRDLCYVLFQQGDVEGAREVITKGISHYPDNAIFYFFLGNLHANMRDHEKAVACFEAALSIQPDYAEAHFNLGIMQHELGRQQEAAASYRKAIDLRPDFAEAHYNLGNTLIKLARPGDAEACYREAVRIKPDFIDAHCKLGALLKDKGLLAEAETCYRNALQIKPDFAEVLNNLGNILKDSGRADEAEECYRQALRYNPEFADAHGSLGALYHDLGRLSESEDCYRNALKINPEFAEVHNNLGNTLKDMGRLSEAESCYRNAMQFKPGSPNTLCNLGATLQSLGRIAEAEVCYRQALELNPNHADAYRNMGVTLRDMGRLNEAETCYRRALELNPSFGDAYSNLLFLHSYDALSSPSEYLSLAHGWELSCVPEHDRQAARNKNFQRKPLTGRRLKIGYVSGDFLHHSVSFFIEQIFTHHDRNSVELFAYSNNAARDVVTARLQALVEHWIQIAGMSDATTLDRIDSDGIDVLIDLSGHTARNRLSLFARRAAPVQAYYLGYFASTGLTEMDYWIGDNTLTPQETDGHFSEQVWRLPRVSWSYDGKDAPLQEWYPASDGTVWLGSFNQLNKLTSATLELWAKALESLPEGRLLLKTKELADPTNRKNILDVLSRNGIQPDRIELQDNRITPGWHEHMAYYNRLDIALDPVGAMGGVTSTCDALWMGVPVITLEGDRVTSRATSSILSAIDRTEWVARSEAEYLDKILALARNMDLRKKMRSSQRDRIARSPLCDAKGLAGSLEKAYSEMFNRWHNRNN